MRFIAVVCAILVVLWPAVAGADATEASEVVVRRILPDEAIPVVARAIWQ